MITLYVTHILSPINLAHSSRYFGRTHQPPALRVRTKDKDARGRGRRGLSVHYLRLRRDGWATSIAWGGGTYNRCQGHTEVAGGCSVTCKPRHQGCRQWRVPALSSPIVDDALWFLTVTLRQQSGYLSYHSNLVSSRTIQQSGYLSYHSNLITCPTI